MLAYRHAFHAGNHADVLKHVVLIQLLRHMNLKDKAYRVVDTHAGAGGYALDSPQALKKAEYQQGISRLWGRTDTPEPVADYLRLVGELNGDGQLRQYPGSPMLARRLMRPQDELRLFELHPSDHEALHALFGTSRRVAVQQVDGFAALKSQLPPPSRRAVVLIDPSYEGLGEYTRVPGALRDALNRFAQGVYMVWYPVVGKRGAAAMVQELTALAPHGWLHARLSVQPTDALGYGLAGSGIFVINPPYTLHAQLQTTLPWLASALAQFEGAGHLLEHHTR
jgi:23S rRNA (adenine2030-N6)-methyltransferase